MGLGVAFATRLGVGVGFGFFVGVGFGFFITFFCGGGVATGVGRTRDLSFLVRGGFEVGDFVSVFRGRSTEYTFTGFISLNRLILI